MMSVLLARRLFVLLDQLRKAHGLLLEPASRLLRVKKAAGRREQHLFSKPFSQGTMTNGLRVPPPSPVSQHCHWPPQMAYCQAVTLSSRCKPPASSPLNLPRLLHLSLILSNCEGCIIQFCLIFHQKKWQCCSLLHHWRNVFLLHQKTTEKDQFHNGKLRELGIDLWLQATLMHLLDAKATRLIPAFQHSQILGCRRHALPLNLIWSENTLEA